MPKPKSNQKKVLASYYIEPDLKGTVENILKKGDVKAALKIAGCDSNSASVIRGLLKMFSKDPKGVAAMMAEVR